MKLSEDEVCQFVSQAMAALKNVKQKWYNRIDFEIPAVSLICNSGAKFWAMIMPDGSGWFEMWFCVGGKKFAMAKSDSLKEAIDYLDALISAKLKDENAFIEFTKK